MTTGKGSNICPQCGYQFNGYGFDGIDAHWRARHEHIMPYAQAWPLIKSGAYPNKIGSIEAFCGSLYRKNGPRFTIAQIKKITEDAWAGKR